MKVLHVNYFENQGGASIAANQIHNCLLREQVKSQLLVSEKISSDQNVITDKSFIASVSRKCREKFNRNLFKFLNEKSTNTQSSGLLRSLLPYKINKLKHDIINLHWINNEMMSIKDVTRINKPIIWTIHDLWPISGKDHYYNRKNIGNSFIDNFIKNSKRKNWDRLFKIVCPSNWVFKKVRQSDVLKNNEAQVIPHPIDISLWKRIFEKEVLFKIFNLENFKDFSKHKILLFGADRATKNLRKGYKLAFEAAKNCSKNFKIIFIVFGDDQKENIRINNNLYLIKLGRIEDRNTKLRALYSLSDIMLVPSKEEVFGLTAAESIATGTPVITLRGTGTEDIIKDNINGCVADEKNFVNCTNELLNSEEKLRVFSKQGIEFIKKNFDPHIIANKYIEVYKECLKTKINIF